LAEPAPSMAFAMDHPAQIVFAYQDIDERRTGLVAL
jgi:hypothetical protein